MDSLRGVLADRDRGPDPVARPARTGLGATLQSHPRSWVPDRATETVVRVRQRVTKGPSSRAAGIAMAFKLIESAQARRRMVNAPHLMALVRAGVPFTNGKQVECPDQSNTQRTPRDTPIHRS